MSDSHPKKLVEDLASTMEEAELVVGASGADKRLYVVEAMRAIAARKLLDVDDASLVDSLIPSLVDLLVRATNGLLHVNEKGEPSPRCCALL